MAEDFNSNEKFNTQHSTHATIGSSIVIKGEVSGSEDLVIEGTLEGSVHLKENTVTVGSSAKVNADIDARTIRVQGEVKGDLCGKETVVVESTGRVLGNITSPKLSLEEGARLKGAIDTDPDGGDDRVAVSVSKSIPVKKEQTSVTEADTSEPKAVSTKTNGKDTSANSTSQASAS